MTHTLGTIFTALANTSYDFRVKTLKNFLGLFVSKPFAAELFLLAPKWQLWLFRLLCDLPDEKE